MSTREDVDSGYDKKIMVEKILLGLLDKGFPEEIITEDPKFNIRHREMINNVSRMYHSKKEKLEGMYEKSFGDDDNDSTLGSMYGDIIHDIRELYPMTPEEEKGKFTKRDDLIKQIDRIKKTELRDNIKKRDQIVSKMAKIKIKYPVLDSIISLVRELDEYQENGTLTPEITNSLLVKYNLDPKKFAKLNVLYSNYAQLEAECNRLSEYIVSLEKNISNSTTIISLENELRDLENELVYRNLKLVNFYIRKNCKLLLVDQEDLHEILTFAIYDAVKKFDVSKNYKFSSYAFNAMRNHLRKEFIHLTGLSWEDYWKKEKLVVLLESASEALNRPATIRDLAELGLLDISYDKAKALNETPIFLLESILYDNQPEDYLYTEDDYEEADLYEDMMSAPVSTEADEIEDVAIFSNLQDNISNVLNTLTDRERIIIVLRLGLDQNVYLSEEERKLFGEYIGPQTLETVGNIFGVSRERIRQSEAKALRKLRHPSRARYLADEGKLYPSFGRTR